MSLSGRATKAAEVPVSRSQEAIRKSVYTHKGAGINFMSQPPPEGFEALVTMLKQAYHIRVMATSRPRQTKEEAVRFQLRRVPRRSIGMFSLSPRKAAL